MNTFLLLGADTQPFLLWWLASVLLGIGCYPLGAVLFRYFDDRGWLFSKALGIGTAGWLVFLLGRFRILPFTSAVCIAASLSASCLCWLLFLLFGTESVKMRPDWKVILEGELLFLLVFLFWTWCSGFRPAATGTEKPMDYGFMAAMMRSEEIPARDIWYSQGVLNYYYGGQFYAVYLTKLTFTRVNEAYHLMRGLVAAFTFSLSWSLIRQALQDRGLGSYAAETGGLFAGAAVSLAGNGHYLVYGLLGPVFRLSGWEDYWFPSSTRYIGHNPLTEDQCIHEFPSYSFVLGDLHAHMINLFLVLTVTGILYAWFQVQEKEGRKGFRLRPHIAAAGIAVGIFKWTNYWDFIIYYTVFLFAAVCLAFRGRKRGSLRWILEAGAEAVLAAVLQALAAWPFTSQFDTMFRGVAFSRYHTAPYQFLILWGIPIFVSLLFALTAIRRNTHWTDLFFLMLALCGLGLICIPELVYVVDIYEGGYARSNTMFKLTYQAFVLLGLMMSYAFFRILGKREKLRFRIPAALSAGIVFLTFGYGGYAVNCWFGNIFDRSGYQGLDAAAFLETDYPEDAAAIRWLDASVSGQETVLEAPGDSYSSYCRVSAVTGLPTPEGWYVHEWLWRNDPEDLNRIREDVDQIYTGSDPEEIRQLLEKYGISWIFLGNCEREEYGDALNETLLRSLGTVCFDGKSQGIADGALVIRIDAGSSRSR